MWSRYLLFECPEKHILIINKDIKVVNMFKRKPMICTGYITNKKYNITV